MSKKYKKNYNQQTCIISINTKGSCSGWREIKLDGLPYHLEKERVSIIVNMWVNIQKYFS